MQLVNLIVKISNILILFSKKLKINIKISIQQNIFYTKNFFKSKKRLRVTFCYLIFFLMKEIKKNSF